MTGGQVGLGHRSAAAWVRVRVGWGLVVVCVCPPDDLYGRPRLRLRDLPCLSVCLSICVPIHNRCAGTATAVCVTVVRCGTVWCTVLYILLYFLYTLNFYKLERI